MSASKTEPHHDNRSTTLPGSPLPCTFPSPAITNRILSDAHGQSLDNPQDNVSSNSTQLLVDTDAKNISDLEEELKERPTDLERQVIHYCLDRWWVMVNAELVGRQSKARQWGTSFFHSSKSLDSADRINKNMAPTDHKRTGSKADLLWRTMIAPEQDSEAAEAASEWDPLGENYRYE
ncbi:hypothetical protein BGX21_008387, partial [Mortierella sp. AD011]